MLRTKGEKSFAVVNYLFLTLFTLLCIFPVWDVVRVSLSTPADASRAGFRLWPGQVSFTAYQNVLGNSYVWSGYRNTLARLLIGVPLNMALSLLASYTLSRRYMPARSIFTMFIVFTMFFSGGMIPSYLVIKDLGLFDTVWALVLPGALHTYNMLIMRNYMMSIPASLEESAMIDGANHFTILLRIFIPLSGPIIATVALWSIVGHWNAWFDCMLYIRKPEQFVLQTILRKIVIDAAPGFGQDMGTTDVVNLSAEVVKCATIIVSTLPILVIYPFLQKYFVKGIMVGSLKG